MKLFPTPGAVFTLTVRVVKSAGPTDSPVSVVELLPTARSPTPSIPWMNRHGFAAEQGAAVFHVVLVTLLVPTRNPPTVPAGPLGPLGPVAPVPAGRAAETFASLQSTAKIRMGQPAERIDLGEEGWAYGSGSGAEAAAMSAGKVYHARIRIPLGTTATSRKDAMVGLVGRLID